MTTEDIENWEEQNGKIQVDENRNYKLLLAFWFLVALF